MRQFKHFLVVLTLAIIAAPAVAKEDTELSELIDAVVTTYGGESLTGLKNYRISDHYISPASGQSRTPSLDNIGGTSQLLVRDIEGNRLYFENWFKGRSGVFSNATLINGDKASDMNLLAGPATGLRSERFPRAAHASRPSTPLHGDAATGSHEERGAA